MDGYGPIPNQQMNRTAEVRLSTGKFVRLSQGAYVKYVAKLYMPQHHPFGDYNEAFQVAAYTQFGMALIDRSDLNWNVC